MSSRISKTEARGFDPREGIKWTAETRIEAVKKLVRDREQVFAKHRALANCKCSFSSRYNLKANDTFLFMMKPNSNLWLYNTCNRCHTSKKILQLEVLSIVIATFAQL